MPHEDCVNLIKRAGDTLALKVVTANTSSMTQSHYAATHSLPYRRKGRFSKQVSRQIKNIFQYPFVRVLKSPLVVCLYPFVWHDSLYFLTCFSFFIIE